MDSLLFARSIVLEAGIFGRVIVLVWTREERDCLVVQTNEDPVLCGSRGAGIYPASQSSGSTTGRIAELFGFCCCIFCCSRQA